MKKLILTIIILLIAIPASAADFVILTGDTVTMLLNYQVDPYLKADKVRFATEVDSDGNHLWGEWEVPVTLKEFNFQDKPSGVICIYAQARDNAGQISPIVVSCLYKPEKPGLDIDVEGLILNLDIVINGVSVPINQ